jgi:hypothetical protein
MGLSVIIEQDKTGISHLFQDFFDHGDAFYVRIEYIINNNDILVWFPRLISVMDHLTAYNTERNGGFFVTYYCIEDKGTS